MTRPLAVLRPEPGNAATARRIAYQGLEPLRLPLFRVRALPWAPPDPADFDALLVTSANAVRHAGAGLAALRHLPVLAVGEATARTADAAGLGVVLIGTADAAALLAEARARGIARPLHLAGRERVAALTGVERVTVYASEALTIAPADLASLSGSVALLHSPRAAARLAGLVSDRARLRVAALSPAVAAAVGEGWDAVAVAAVPTDAALIEVAASLAD